MTKTLTEQWRDGTLPDGHYYVQYDKCYPFIREAYAMRELKKCRDSEKIDVLDEVPSYDHFHQLVKKVECLRNKLEIATKALEQYANCKPTE